MDAAGDAAAIWPRLVGKTTIPELQLRPREAGSWRPFSGSLPVGDSGPSNPLAIAVAPSGQAVLSWIKSGPKRAAVRVRIGSLATGRFAAPETVAVSRPSSGPTLAAIAGRTPLVGFALTDVAAGNLSYSFRAIRPTR
jgi:hypothetical protein